MSLHHVNTRGEIKPCGAEKGQCPYTLHGESKEATQRLYEAEMNGGLLPLPKHKVSRAIVKFDEISYYGLVPPRPVQLQALNDVVGALDKEESTQLVAACGVGKSYMGRQILRHQMEKPGATGIGIVLTSSIKLASDTAEDLRPTGGYDETFGKYGIDYEVIEVHSGVKTSEHQAQTVLENGSISVERIRQKIEKAVAQGKKVVIVSTYDSAARVQEAQGLLASERYDADLIIHDEAHNVLGQQRPTSVAGDDNDLTAYTGFHNLIPGAIQAKRRLYATASPVLREAPGDAESPADLEEARIIAEKMRSGDQWARVTYYSDDELVGRVSGFISQEDAIQAGCLARPSYSVRETGVKGKARGFKDPVVRSDGSLIEREESSERWPLSISTYGAVRATLEAMVEDPETGKNPPTNALAYVGSIAQAEAFRDSFASVARAEAGDYANRSPFELVKLAHGPEGEERRRARMALLAMNAEVKAAHSSPSPEAIAERKAAFKMFAGHGVKEGQWSPNRRVLANVDIFSEGVSINEIDTVVIADDEKCSERAMTQAIGRSIRTLPSNGYKTTGHVIVPSVLDEDSTHLNEASVHLAAYGASRVERGLIARKLRGEGVRPDEKTSFRVKRLDGTSEEKLARAYAQESVSEVLPLAAAAEMLSGHQYLLKNEPTYRDADAATQVSWVKSRIKEKSEARKDSTPEGRADKERLQAIYTHVKPLSAQEVREERRNARVVTSALSVGDLSSLSPGLTAKLVRGGVLRPKSEVASVTVETKREHVKKHSATLRYALLTNPAGMSEVHKGLRASLPPEVQDKRTQSESMKLLRGGPETPATRKLEQAFEALLSSDSFVESAYDFSRESDPKRLPIIDGPLWRGVVQDLKAQEEERAAQQDREALDGVQEYAVDSSAVRKTGELKSNVLRDLLRV